MGNRALRLSDEQINRLLQIFEREVENHHAAQQLTDSELLRAVTSSVWASFNVDSKESALISELLDRFAALAGIEVGP